MRTFIFSAIAASVFIAGLSVGSQAQTRQPRRINQREHRQQKRITQGVRSGELTAAEALRLEREQVKLRQLEARLRDSGDRLSPKERARLERDLNRTSRDIYRQKHDRQDRRP